MNRRDFAFFLTSAAACFTIPVIAQGNSGNHGHGHGHDNQDDNDHGHGHGNGHAYGHSKHAQRYFPDNDQASIIRYYNGPRNLPPGLRKKYYRYGTLPPGWQKRFQPMPPVLIQQLPPIPVGYQRGYYDGYAVVIDPRTRIIYDALDIVGALSSR
ncbi:MAG TPA: hypothetical protein VFE38_04520 [Edaphobacter sp.]|nr:hypothetical protein [Edaphobacter sp.]